MADPYASRVLPCSNLVVLFVLACILVLNVHPAQAQPNDVLKTLRSGHPRLLVSDDELVGVQKAIESEALAKAWDKALTARATKMLDEPVVEHKLIGPRLLSQSRDALNRISTLAGMYRLHHDPRFAERARREMLAATAFKDWNPSHFLDVAEMTNALAIGYDWLYADLSPADRQTIRQAIVEKGLLAGKKAYETNAFWTHATHNWAQVCAGGLTDGALAVADEEPEIARFILLHARDTMIAPMKEFAPDGGTSEGPGYWDYATRYTVFYLASTKLALGNDFGFSDAPGFDKTSQFRLYFTGPLGKTANFSDSGDTAGIAPQMLWMARRFHRPDYAKQEREVAEHQPNIFDLFWWNPAEIETRSPPLPLDAVYKRVNVAYFRSAWDDPKAAFLAFKAGDNKANHSHLDLGSFILDADGQRWAEELGGDDYDLPGYFGNKRFSYYRLRTEGQNTLVIDGQNQDAKAAAPITGFVSTPTRAAAVADLTAAYAAHAKRVRRGVALLDRRLVLVQDEVQAEQPIEIVWNLHTNAHVAVDSAGRSATLTQKDATLRATILEPAGAKFNAEPVDLKPPQRPTKGVTNLMVRLPEKTNETRIVVLLSPGGENESAPAIQPLDQWFPVRSNDQQ